MRSAIATLCRRKRQKQQPGKHETDKPERDGAMTGKKITIKEIITANELVSGASVYLSYAGHWLPEMQKARVFLESEQDERERQMEKAENSTRLISIETVRVVHRRGRIEPLRLREKIRASGPTTPRHRPQQILVGDHVSL